MYPRAATAINGHLTRIHVEGTLAFLATASEQLGMYEPLSPTDQLVRGCRGQAIGQVGRENPAP